MNWRLATFVSVIAAASIVAGGCGGGSGKDGGQSTAEAPTKAAFIKRADAICEQTDKKQEVVIRAYSKRHPEAESSQSGLEGVVVVALPPVQVEAQELDNLPTPSGDETEIKAIVDGIEEAVNKAKAEPSKLVGRISRGPFTHVGKLAAKYGFKACAFPL